jgi:hypothetical protein
VCLAFVQVSAVRVAAVVAPRTDDEIEKSDCPFRRPTKTSPGGAAAVNRRHSVDRRPRRSSLCGVASAGRESDPPELALLLFAKVVVGEEHRQHRVVGTSANPIARVAAVFDYFGDLEAARPMGVESRSDLYAAPWTHAPIVSRF